MKKTNSKLQLKTNTLRALQNSELERVVGGAPTNECSQVANCTSHPTYHTPGSNVPTRP